jgi:hypothetical protein
MKPSNKDQSKGKLCELKGFSALVSGLWVFGLPCSPARSVDWPPLFRSEVVRWAGSRS